MLVIITLISALLSATTASPIRPRSNGLKTPIMGYNSYNDVACSPNGTWMESSINAMHDKGLVDLGYDYFQMDCGWQGFERLSNGSITYDSASFPDGISPLSDLARSHGMKWGMYTDQGIYSCDTRNITQGLRPGSLGHELEDAEFFASLSTEYLKVDNCYVNGIPPPNAPKDPRTDFVIRYSTMWNALTSVGINEMLVCEWGTPYIDLDDNLQGPAQWTPPISTSFRLSDDIAMGWDNVMRIVNEAIHINIKGYNGPGNFADMDILEVGNPGMTVAEQRSHFSLWAAFKSALMISTNVPDMSQDTFEILSNKDIIAINQDELAKPVKLVQRFTKDYDIYAGPLSGGDQVVLLLDTSNKTRTLSIDMAKLNITSADIKDLWASTTKSQAATYSASVAAHGSVILRLSNIEYAVPPTTRVPVTYYNAASAFLSGGATLQSCPSCPSGQKVGNINANTSSSLTFTNITATQSTQDVRFDYFNCNIQYAFTGAQESNVRGASISVNGGEVMEVYFPVTGYDWERDKLTDFLVRLNGFRIGGGNNITITGDETIGNSGLVAWAPDFDRIGVV